MFYRLNLNQWQLCVLNKSFDWVYKTFDREETKAVHVIGRRDKRRRSIFIDVIHKDGKEEAADNFSNSLFYQE